MKLQNCTYEYLLIGRSPIRNSDEYTPLSKNNTLHIPVHTRPISKLKHSAPNLWDLFTHLNWLLSPGTKAGPGFVPLTGWMFMVQESNLINSMALLTILILLPALNPLLETDKADYSPQLHYVNNLKLSRTIQVKKYYVLFYLNIF